MKTAFKDYTRYDSWFGVDFPFVSDLIPAIVTVPAFNGCKISVQGLPESMTFVTLSDHIWRTKGLYVLFADKYANSVIREKPTSPPLALWKTTGLLQGETSSGKGLVSGEALLSEIALFGRSRRVRH